MPINPDIAIGADIGEDSYSWSASDVALYNLAVGAAADPMDEAGLGYIHDSEPKVLPSFATVAPTFHVTEAPKVVFPGIDIDLAHELGKSLGVAVNFVDSSFARLIDDLTQRPTIGHARLDALARLHGAGLRTFLAVQPMLPMDPARLVALTAPHAQ